MNLQATVLPALLGTQIGRCSFPWGGQSLHPARALPCPVRSPQGWMQGSVVRSPGWGCPRSACAHPALLFLVLWVRWPGRTVYLVGPAGETGRRVVTVLLALVTQAWLSCSHPNQLYTQVSAWLKPPVSPPFWALAHSVYPTPPPGSPRAEQFRFFSCRDLRPTPALISHRGVYWETLGELPELKKHMDTQAFGGSCPELTAASRPAALHPGQSLRRPVTRPPVPGLIPFREKLAPGLGAGALLQVGQPWLVGGQRTPRSAVSPLTHATLSVLRGPLCLLQEAPLHAQPCSWCIRREMRVPVEVGRVLERCVACGLSCL